MVERIGAELNARHDEWYAEFERARDDSRIRYEDLVARHELPIEEFDRLRQDQRYRFDKIDMDMEHSRRTNRETCSRYGKTRRCSATCGMASRRTPRAYSASSTRSAGVTARAPPAPEPRYNPYERPITSSITSSVPAPMRFSRMSRQARSIPYSFM